MEPDDFKGRLPRHDLNQITNAARKLCAELFSQDYDALDVEAWPHIASYYVAKKLREIDPDSDEAKVALEAMAQLVAPYASWQQRKATRMPWEER